MVMKQVCSVILWLLVCLFLTGCCDCYHVSSRMTGWTLRRSDARSPLHMAASGGKGKGGGGGTALDTRIKQEVKTSIKDEIERDYRLILHDDTLHTIQQVCEILGKVMGFPSSALLPCCHDLLSKIENILII